MNLPINPTVLVPVGKKRELPEPAMNVLRGLWARLGYQSNSFVDMQLEISKELAHADFARFEREMLCNEIMSLRQEIDVIRVDRNEQARRAEAAQNELVHVIASEERTFKALVAEREISKRAIDQAEKGVNQVVIAKEKEALRAEAMSEEIHRLEKERLAAVLYARTAEEQAALANVTAKTAAAVAMTAVQSNQQSLSPRSPSLMPHAPSPRFSRPHTPSILHHHGRSPSTSRSTLTESPNVIPSRPQTPHLSSTMAKINENWNQVDAAILASQLRERELEVQQSRLTAEANKLNQDRIKLRFDIDRNRANSPFRTTTPKVTYQGLRN